MIFFFFSKKKKRIAKIPTIKIIETTNGWKRSARFQIPSQSTDAEVPFSGRMFPRRERGSIPGAAQPDSAAEKTPNYGMAAKRETFSSEVQVRTASFPIYLQYIFDARETGDLFDFAGRSAGNVRSVWEKKGSRIISRLWRFGSDPDSQTLKEVDRSSVRARVSRVRFRVSVSERSPAWRSSEFVPVLVSGGAERSHPGRKSVFSYFMPLTPGDFQKPDYLLIVQRNVTVCWFQGGERPQKISNHPGDVLSLFPAFCSFISEYVPCAQWVPMCRWQVKHRILRVAKFPCRLKYWKHVLIFSRFYGSSGKCIPVQLAILPSRSRNFHRIIPMREIFRHEFRGEHENTRKG